MEHNMCLFAANVAETIDKIISNVTLIIIFLVFIKVFMDGYNATRK